MQRTLAIVKPDGVAAGLVGEVVKRIEQEGLRIVGMRMEHMTQTKAEGFYYVHRERPFFGSLMEFMTSGPVVLMARITSYNVCYTKLLRTAGMAIFLDSLTIPV